VTWRQLLEHWARIEADLQERYGIDVADEQLMTTRSWHWLRRRIFGLLQIPLGFTPDGRPVHATRLGHALFPTPDPPKRGES
jgi:hypothetical protein